MRTKTKKKVTKTRVAFLLFCTVLPVLQFLIFYVYLNASAITMAFRNMQGDWGFDNFTRLWREITNPDSYFRMALRNTMITFGIGVVRFPFQVLVSYFIYKKIPGHGFYRNVFFIPRIVFSVALSLIITYMIAPQGFIAQWVGNMVGLDYAPELLADSRFANYTIWAELLWLGFPGDLIIWGGTFARIPTDVLECARIDGVSWWTEFTRIVVPMVWPTVALNMVLMVCGIFSAGGNVWLLTKGDYGTHTISSWMFKQLYESSGGAFQSNVYNYLSAQGLVITVIAVGLSLVVRRWTDKAFDEVEF